MADGEDRGLGSRCQRGSLTGGEGRVREPPIFLILRLGKGEPWRVTVWSPGGGHVAWEEGGAGWVGTTPRS